MPERILHRILDRLRGANPRRLFWLFALGHLFIWTLVPSLVCPNAPLDVIEGYVWGHEWQFGTYKHPPMQSWLLEIFALLTNRAPWAHFLLSQIAILVTFWAVWKTGRAIAGKMPALVGVMLLEGVVYYNFTSPEFNPNVLQLPFWALAAWSFHRAVRKDKVIDWMLLGLWAAAGLYTKYSMGILLLMLGLLLIIHPDGQRRLKSIGPYLAALVAAILFLPHTLWLVDHQFMPIAYAQDRIHQDPRWHYHLVFPHQFLLSQLVAVAAAIFLVLSLPRRPPQTQPHHTFHSFDHIFLHFVAFGPFIVMLTISALFGLRMRDMWGTPLWSFAGLWVTVNLCPDLTKYSLRRFAATWVAVFTLAVAVFVDSCIFSAYAVTRPLRTDFPGRAIAKAVDRAWHHEFPDAPLRYVIGDTWVAGNVAYYAPERPHVLIMNDYRISPWVDPIELKRSGGILVWCADHCLDQKYASYIPSYLEAAFPGVKIEQPLTFLRQTQAEVAPVVIGWAIIPPAP